MRNPKFLAILLAIAALATPPAFAVNKDLIQIQTQIQDLQDAVAKLQQSNDERMGVLKDLVQQNADSVNKMSQTIDALTKLMRTETEATGGRFDQLSGQITALNDSTDEIKARIGNLEKALQDIQSQQQSINGVIQNLAPNPAATAAATPGATATTPALGLNSPDVPANPVVPSPAPQQAPIVNNRRGKPSAGVPLADDSLPAPVPAAPSAPIAPPVSDLYKTALSDYMSAKYSLASNEFGEVIRIYPYDIFSGQSFYYLGEIDYRAGKFSAAIKDYDHVLEQFPDNAKVPVSHLHKAMALLALKQTEAGIREMRALIIRFPASPEASQARTKLNGLGVPIVPRITTARP
jgi:TolA-binding protein